MPTKPDDSAAAELAQRVSVASYDTSWPEQYERERPCVLSALGPLALDIEHVGSTSVRGLDAKPTIDILVGAHSLDLPESVIGRMAQIGYEYRGEMGVPGRRYFRKGHRYPRSFNVHIAIWRGQLWNDNLAFRDYLRDHPERAREYADLKRQILASPGGATLEGYSAGKASFIAETVRRAHRLQPPPLHGE